MNLQLCYSHEHSRQLYSRSLFCSSQRTYIYSVSKPASIILAALNVNCKWYLITLIGTGWDYSFKWYECWFMSCFELQYHSLFSLSVVIWRWFIMKNSDCRKWLICKWANKNGRHQISRWWLMNLNVGWLLRVKPAWFWTVSSGSSGCFAAVGELWFPKLMDDNPGWNTCCPWYMCTAFTTTSGCICRVCKWG